MSENDLKNFPASKMRKLKSMHESRHASAMESIKNLGRIKPSEQERPPAASRRQQAEKKEEEPMPKQIERMKPEDLEIEQPWNDPLWEAHLQWLLENEPQVTWERLQKDPEGLRKQILLTVKRAVIYKLELQKKPNLDEDQVEELVYQVVGPSDGPALSPDPPEPLEDEKREKLLAWALNPPQPKLVGITGLKDRT